jgi:N utilization substance protein B
MDELRKKTRRQEREDIIKKLYEIDINNGDISFLEENEFTTTSIQGVIEHIEKIDEIITVNLDRWRINRLTYIDRAIIRFATYELYYTETPHEIVINEALNLTKKYSDEGDNKMVGFTNKVLDNIKKYLKK